MTIGFVPVRGGSKGIPLKNIKPLAGKPLVYWVLAAMQQSPEVDKIVVATDSMQIEEVVKNFGLSKVEVYQRSAANAADKSTTESVMLEYLEKSPVQPADTFMLVQATTPYTTANDFTAALLQYGEGNYDSMLSCAHTHKFLWDKNGQPLNYDPQNRPRRQDFDGTLLENGAFYVSKVEHIKKTGCRISGNIGVYKMADYTTFEIDEPADWIIAEGLLLNSIRKQSARRPTIKAFFTDVDGTLTDGGMYYSPEGEALKKFNTRDGHGFELLRNKGVLTGIITSETTGFAESRAAKLKMDFYFAGFKHLGKLERIRAWIEESGIALENIAYIGDDVNCLELLSAVGTKACPADAHEKVKQIPGIYVCSRNGGHGAVREFIDQLIDQQSAL